MGKVRMPYVLFGRVRLTLQRYRTFCVIASVGVSSIVELLVLHCGFPRLQHEIARLGNNKEKSLKTGHAVTTSIHSMEDIIRTLRGRMCRLACSEDPLIYAVYFYLVHNGKHPKCIISAVVNWRVSLAKSVSTKILQYLESVAYLLADCAI